MLNQPHNDKGERKDQSMKIAKATERDKAQVKVFFNTIEDAIEIDNASREVLGSLVELAWAKRPGIAEGWRRVIHGYDVLRDHMRETASLQAEIDRLHAKLKDTRGHT